jgi:hypothetical protein
LTELRKVIFRSAVTGVSRLPQRFVLWPGKALHPTDVTKVIV